MSHAYLVEIPEAEAEGQVAEIYEDIRLVLGVPVVNLVYRRLAVEPELLVAVWRSLRPNLASRTADRAAGQLVALATPPVVTPLPAAALAAVGVDGDRARLARSTLDAYARANSRNLLGMHALLDGCRGTGASAEPIEAPPPTAVLPSVRPDALPAAARRLLREMSAALVGGEPPILVPSLLRHFATDPPLLALLWTALRPAAGSDLGARRDALALSARGLAGALPHPVAPLERSADRGLAGRFAVAMSTLLVTGEAIRLALGEAP